MVYFITGRQGAGKTTLAYRLHSSIANSVVLDGDEVRSLLPTGFTNFDRYTNIMRIAACASILEKQGYVPIIALIAPKRDWRMAARKLFKECSLIYIPGGKLWEGTEYEEPDEEEIKWMNIQEKV